MPALALQWCASHDNLFGVVPIIVYQMAKVGSTAVVVALRSAGLPVFQVHRMDAAHLARMRKERRRLGWADQPVPAHDRLGIRLTRRVIARNARAAIVTLVRDPIARNLSSYFEHLDAIWRTTDAHERVSTEALIRGFHERFPHQEPLTWFDDEMLPVTGIDVYQHPFPAEGHAVLARGNVGLLVLKSELPDAVKVNVLGDFLGVPSLSIAPVNRTENKAKGSAYKRFLQALRLDRDYVETMLESRYARHFYTSAERDQFREKYLTRAPQSHT